MVSEMNYTHQDLLNGILHQQAVFIIIIIIPFWKIGPTNFTGKGFKATHPHHHFRRVFPPSTVKRWNALIRYAETLQQSNMRATNRRTHVFVMSAFSKAFVFAVYTYLMGLNVQMFPLRRAFS